MPPIENPLNNLPVDKINPDAAVQQLSKSNDGAIFTIGVWMIIIAAATIFVTIFYFSNKRDTQRDKDDINCQAKMGLLQHQYDSVCGNLSRLVDYNHEQDKTIIQLRDSLKMQQLLKHYHITEGKQTIILTPKNIQQ